MKRDWEEVEFSSADKSNTCYNELNKQQAGPEVVIDCHVVVDKNHYTDPGVSKKKLVSSNKKQKILTSLVDTDALVPEESDTG